jgi:hypothetical protein
VSESSNNPNLKYVITPPVEGGTEHKNIPEQPTPQITKQRNIFEIIREFESTVHGKVITVLAGLAIAGGAVGGAVAANAGKAPEKAPVTHSTPANPGHTAEASPSATPSATPETTNGPDSYNYNLTQADVANLVGADVYALNQLPTEEKAKLPMFYAQTLPNFAKSWEAVSKNPKDVLPDTVSGDNTPDQINAFISMQARQAMTLTKADGFHFDKQAADAYISAQLINGTLSVAYGPLSGFAAQLDGPDSAPSARSLPASDYMQLPIINNSGAKYTDAAGHLCIDMNITQNLNGGAAPVTENITACLVKNEKGSIWMRR